MSDPVFVPERVVLAIHDRQIAEHGGAAGVRDRGLLESALGRAEFKASYGETDLAVLAAAYAFSIARNHPFLDGNKRTAFVVSQTFLRLEGSRLDVDHAEAVRTFLALAAGELGDEALADWFRAHQRPLR